MGQVTYSEPQDTTAPAEQKVEIPTTAIADEQMEAPTATVDNQTTVEEEIG